MKTQYPSWVKEILTPGLEEKSPIKTGSLWLHPKQKNGKITGDEIYQHIKDTDTLKDCVSLKTLQYYEKNPSKIPYEWKGKWIYAWKSVVRSDDGYLDVPFLRCYVEAPYVDWCRLGDRWLDREPALREQVSTLNSDTKDSFDSLPLELSSAIELVKKAGYKIFKEI